MSLEPIGIITIIIGIISIYIGIDFAILVLTPLTLLGAAGAILLSSGTIQPPHLFLGFILIVLFFNRAVISDTFSHFKTGRIIFWLFALNIYATVSAIFFPRIFSGITQVNTIGVSDYGPAVLEVPLGPTSGNITQTIYQTANFFCFLFITLYCRSEKEYRVLLRSIVICAFTNIFFAAADLITFWTNTPYLLGFIRNAGYALHIEEAGAGLHRIAGSFTETSAFSYATIGILCFTARLFIIGFQPIVMGVISAISLFLLLISTSSTAIAVVPIIILYQYFISAVDIMIRRHSRSQIAFIAIAPFSIIAIVL
ncbi:hypothetical protein FV225_28400, partial [Methylobacterium sp. WL93]